MKLHLPPVSVIALRGGYGNQLFAWAYGQGLKSKGHVVVYDPGSRLGRGFALDGLIPATARLPLPAAFWRRIALLDSSWPRRCKLLVNIEDQQKTPSHFSASSGVLLHWGYWQSADYFSSVQEKVAHSLTRWLNIDPNDRYSECAIHVRRGDYVSDPAAATIMGTLPLSYYRSAIEQMKDRGFSHFVVYSDDRGWVEDNLVPLDENIRVAASDPEQDFVNMAKSSGLITANSSYSWWAGFIASFFGATVIAPRRWFADTTLDSSRIAPQSWTTL